MGIRSALALLLLASLVSLTPLAQATPSDPTWIAGFYDDADYDDVVGLVTGVDGALDAERVATASALLLVAGHVSTRERDGTSGPPRVPSRSRAPPAS